SALPGHRISTASVDSAARNSLLRMCPFFHEVHHVIGLAKRTFGRTMAWLLCVAAAVLVLPNTAAAQSDSGPPSSTNIEREKLSLAGWDPDEPVPAYAYYTK